MSKGIEALPVVEWSPNQVRVYRTDRKDLAVGPSIESVMAAIGDSREVVVAMSRRSSFLRTARLPDAPKKDVAKILALQLGQLFPLAPGDAAVDFYLTDDRNVEGRLAVVAAVKSDVLRQLNAELAEHGLTTRAVVPAALGSAFLAKQTGRRECAILEESPEGLTIDIVHEGELRASRVVPMPDPAYVDVEVERSFAVAKLPCSETLTAGGFTYPEANGFLPQTGLSTLTEGALPLTLEPPEVVEKRERAALSRGRSFALLAWVVAILLALLVADFRTRDLEALEKGQSKLKKAVADLRKSDNQAQAKLTDLQKIDKALDLAFEPKQQFSDVTILLNNLTTEGLWLTGITLERGKLAQIRGTATTGEAVTKFQERLATQPRFRDVKLIFANSGEIEKVGIVQFSIQAHIVGNFPLEVEVKK